MSSQQPVSETEHASSDQQHAILRALRARKEGCHRSKLRVSSADLLYHGFRVKKKTHELADMGHGQANTFCNKVAALYTFARKSKRPCRRSLSGFEKSHPVTMYDIHHTLWKYIYDRWFRPFRSEIEHGQFLVQILNPNYEPHVYANDSFPDLAAALTASISNKVVEAKHRLLAADPRPSLDQNTGFSHRRSRDEVVQSMLTNEFYVLQPLFRAVAVAFYCDEYFPVHMHVKDTPVSIVLTGDEERLSGPITFNSIHSKVESYVEKNGRLTAANTTLETAVAFLMDLERREACAFGLKPDPSQINNDPSLAHLQGFYRNLGWNSGLNRDTSLTFPSSLWVDPKQAIPIRKNEVKCNWHIGRDLTLGLEERRSTFPPPPFKDLGPSTFEDRRLW